MLPLKDREKNAPGDDHGQRLVAWRAQTPQLVNVRRSSAECEPGAPSNQFQSGQDLSMRQVEIKPRDLNQADLDARYWWSARQSAHGCPRPSRVGRALGFGLF